MALRLLIAVVGIVGVFLVLSAIRLWVAARKRALKRLSPDPQFNDAGPTVLYFYTDSCAPCRDLQEPALRRLKASVDPSLRVVKIDALAMPEVADRYKVMTVPTTIILDAEGKVTTANFGYISEQKLAEQLAKVGIAVQS